MIVNPQPSLLQEKVQPRPHQNHIGDSQAGIQSNLGKAADIAGCDKPLYRPELAGAAAVHGAGQPVNPLFPQKSGKKLVHVRNIVPAKFLDIAKIIDSRGSHAVSHSHSGNHGQLVAGHEFASADQRHIRAHQRDCRLLRAVHRIFHTHIYLVGFRLRKRIFHQLLPKSADCILPSRSHAEEEKPSFLHPFPHSVHLVPGELPRIKIIDQEHIQLIQLHLAGRQRIGAHLNGFSSKRAVMDSHIVKVQKPIRRIAENTDKELRRIHIQVQLESLFHDLPLPLIQQSYIHLVHTVPQGYAELRPDLSGRGNLYGIFIFIGIILDLSVVSLKIRFQRLHAQHTVKILLPAVFQIHRQGKITPSLGRILISIGHIHGNSGIGQLRRNRLLS